jgi:hypothetical protein
MAVLVGVLVAVAMSAAFFRIRQTRSLPREAEPARAEEIPTVTTPVLAEAPPTSDEPAGTPAPPQPTAAGPQKRGMTTPLPHHKRDPVKPDPKNDCNPPYTVDEQGKHFKAWCLR